MLCLVFSCPSSTLSYVAKICFSDMWISACFQCSRLVEDFDLRHLSAGELLRAHMASGSPEGKMIDEMIKEGKIVPSEVIKTYFPS